MYTPTGLGAADQGWQQNQQSNQNQLNYGGNGYPQFMGGATDWNSMQGYGGGAGQGGGMGQGQQMYGQPSQIGGYGMNGSNLMTGGQQQPQPGMMQTQQIQPGGAYYGSDGGLQNTGAQGSFDSNTGQYYGNPNSSNPQTMPGAAPQQQQGLAQPSSSGLAGLTDPAAYQSYALSQGINYNPALQASQQAGQQYAGLAGQAGQVGNSMYGEGQYALGTQGQLGQQGNQFNQQQQQLAGQSQQLGYGQLGQSQQLAGGLQQAGQQAYQSGFDPQNALYNQQFQQTTDQANAVNSMYGLGSSGAGAGVTQQAQQNFNTNWENQQLGRQTQGLSAMQGADQSASGILGTGYGGAQTGLNSAGTLGSQGVSGLNSLQQTGAGLGALGNASNQAGLASSALAPGYTQQSAQVPLSEQQTVAGMPGQNATTYASQLGQLMAPYNQQQNQAIPYMNAGIGAGSNAYANTLAGNAQQSQLQGQAGQALGNAASGINWSSVGNWFNPQQTTQNPTSSSDLNAMYGVTGYG